MRIRVLGSAAGGGFPQWNCGCGNCRGIREGTLRGHARTQECVAVSGDGDGGDWFLLNVSPEIRAQIESFPPLHPRAPRHSPVAGIVLTNGDLDHSLGLLSLRESHPLTIYATDHVRRGFTERNILYRTLERFPGQVTWRPLELGRAVDLLGSDGTPSGLAVEAVAAPGKPPVHLEGLESPEPEDNVALRIRQRATGQRLAYCSATGALTAALREVLADADCVFFDGTFWSSDELVKLDLGTKRAEQMAHLPIGGPTGSLAALAGLAAPRRIYIHLNNSNPCLRDDSPEAEAVRRAGWEIARDGMSVEL